MSAVPPATTERAEIKMDLTAVTSVTEEAEVKKERSTSQPSLEPSLNHFKPIASTPGEEDAPDKKPPYQAVEKVSSEDLEKTSTSEVNEVGFKVVERSVGAEDDTTHPSDAKLDLNSQEDAETEQQDEVSRGEVFSDEITQDTDDIVNEIDKEKGLAYIANGQGLYKDRAEKRTVQFEPYFRSVEYRMNFLENELKELRGDNSKAEVRPKVSVGKNSSIALEIVPSIRRMTWANFAPSKRAQGRPIFSQRFTWDRFKAPLNLQEEKDLEAAILSGDKQHGTSGSATKHQHHALEVLIEDPEVSKRRRVRELVDNGNVAKDFSRRANSQRIFDTTTGQSPLSMVESTLWCPERIRICSRPVLQILVRLLNNSDSRQAWDVPHMVFLRPFKLFVLYEAEIRLALKDMEKRWEPMGQTTPIEQSSGRKNEERTSEASNSNDPGNQNDGTTTADGSLSPLARIDTFEALEHLRLLVEFLDNDLKSTFALRRRISAKKDCPIAFSDLWHLYEHGQEVRTPGNQIQVFKVARFTGGRDIWSENLARSGVQFPTFYPDKQESKGSFFVECYSYDFDGQKYGPVRIVFEIRRYEGLRDITSLQVYPWWFDPDHENERIRLARRGEKFIALTRVNKIAHKSYRGLSLDENAEEVSWSYLF